jgi:hypothetical protein
MDPAGASESFVVGGYGITLQSDVAEVHMRSNGASEVTSLAEEEARCARWP